MNIFLVAFTVFLALLFVASLYRIAAGPTVFDRAIGAGLIGTNSVLALVLIGFIYGRVDMFVDLALTYALLNFVGVVAFAKYFERRRVLFLRSHVGPNDGLPTLRRDTKDSGSYL